MERSLLHFLLLIGLLLWSMAPVMSFSAQAEQNYKNPNICYSSKSTPSGNLPGQDEAKPACPFCALPAGSTIGISPMDMAGEITSPAQQSFYRILPARQIMDFRFRLGLNAPLRAPPIA